MKKRSDTVAVIIEVAIILAVIPRWIPALMMAEGLAIPSSWGTWWITVSAIFNAGMAITEAVAIAYVFNVLRDREGREARILLVLAVAMVATFVIVLAPFIAASVAQKTMEQVITSPGSNAMALFWGAAVVLSTGFTVMAVGIAQGGGNNELKREEETVVCWCGAVVNKKNELDHITKHYEEISKFKNPTEAYEYLERQYTTQRDEQLPQIPTLPEILKIQNEMGNQSEDEL